MPVVILGADVTTASSFRMVGLDTPVMRAVARIELPSTSAATTPSGLAVPAESPFLLSPLRLRLPTDTPLSDDLRSALVSVDLRGVGHSHAALHRAVGGDSLHSLRGDVARDQDPLIARRTADAFVAIPSHPRPRASEKECAGVARVMNDRVSCGRGGHPSNASYRLPDEDPDKFLKMVRGVINNPAVEARYAARSRPLTPETPLDSLAFAAVETAVKRHYNSMTLPTMSTGATDMAYLREKGIKCYGIGPAIDVEDGPKGFGAHSDQERILEAELHRFVRFFWDVVVEVAGAR
jgi:hypothetical protein